MKKYCIFLTVFVLTISLFTGCGCTPQNKPGPTTPIRDTMPIVPETTVPATVPTTPSEEATTVPETIPAETGMSGITEPGMDATDGIMDNTAPSGDAAARSRRMR